MSTIKLNNFFSSIKLFFKNFFSSENLNKEIFRYKFNWISVLLFAGIVHYCFFCNLYSYFFIPIALILAFFSKHKAYEDAISIKKQDLFFLTIICFLIIYILRINFNNSFTYDTNYWGNQYIQILISFFDFFFKKYVENNDYLKNIEFRYLLQICNILISAVVIFLVVLYNKIYYRYKVLYTLFIILIVLIFRNIFYIDNSESIMHFRIFPFFIFGNFSISPFSLRLSYLLFLFLFQFLIFKKTNKLVPNLLSLLICTIPLTNIILTLSTFLLDFTVWGYLAILYTVFEIGLNDKIEINYYRIFSILAILQLMRPMAFVCYIPLFFLILYKFTKNHSIFFLKSYKVFFSENIVKLIPVSLIIISLYHCLIIGIYSTYSDNELFKAVGVPINPNFFIKAKFYILKTHKIYLSNVGIFYILCFLYLFIRLTGFINKLLLGLLVFIIIIMLILANPLYWGIPKHMLQFLFPWAFLGLFFLIQDLYNKNFKKLSYFIALLLAIVNIWSISYYEPGKFLYFHKIFGQEQGYAIKKMGKLYDIYLSYVKKNNLIQGSILNTPNGSGYGKFILSGYSYKEYVQYIDSHQKFCLLSPKKKLSENPYLQYCEHLYPYKMLIGMLNDKNSHIKIFAISDYYFGKESGTQKEFIEKMENSGWVKNEHLSFADYFLVMEKSNKS